MNINKQKFSAIILAGFVISLPFVVWAASETGLVPCVDNCDFNQLMIMASNIIKFLTYSVAVPLAALGFMVVGARLIFSQNKETAWTTAKESFVFIAKGFAIIIGAFLLIRFILDQFLSPEQKIVTDLIIG